MRLILASASPRRRALLEALGWSLEIRPADVDEHIPPGEAPQAAVERLAAHKAEAVAPGQTLPVLAADTVVALDGAIFGKPTDAAEARSMLGQLSGRQHEVWSGWCAISPQGRALRGAVCTRVWFRALQAAEIDAYVASKEPMDKAGAYAIQGLGGALVDRIEGSYPNVVGLPLAEVLQALAALEGER